ncbi:MAG TPA: glucose-6-phosphate dehydrogenase [Candidatus Saccharibacteria bacterium]|nr:glucose-6-phosphate dehydrogenase [Candidatus Saccharibacteria bacterium]HRQ07034.1 glucose-6-phosphate dehydrogenase [Candidatus Saccharibacteria bacterium]
MKTKLVIFGVTGDLSTRKLLPALEQIFSTGDFDDVSVIGVSRHKISVKKILRSSLHSTKLAKRMSGFSMNVSEPKEYLRLKEFIDLKSKEQLLIYLSVPPMAAAQIVEFLGDSGINSPNVKLLFEKPFGVDLHSAKDVIKRTAEHFSEDQLYRIDHYLAKEMAQNIVAFRGRNALFSNIWNNNFIESIEIIAAEKIGIEGRAQFYEQTGALRDVVQGHLMQLLALTLMDIPTDFDWNRLPELRQRALDQVRLADPLLAKRAQYEGYQKEVANPGSLTETFVKLELASDQPRWLDVPITLLAGKSLHKKTTEIRIHLKKLSEAQSNCVIFRIQPDEGIDIELFTRKPGYQREFETQHLELKYSKGVKIPDAYEQVLVDAIFSRKSLFTCSGEVLRSWEILQPILDSWSMDKAELTTYKRGTDFSVI